ncbi:MAG: hypothetical protein AB7O32_05625 [Vicinamibacterales bacterium]
MRLKALALAVVAAVSVGCWNPFGPSEYEGSFTYTVDGQPVTATGNGRLALRSSGSLSFTGADCTGGAYFSMFVRPEPTVGTYTVAQGVNASYTPDARSSGGNSPYWETAPITGAQGSGSLTITSISSDRVAGSFTFVLAPRFNSTATGTRRVEGSFDLEIADKPVC